MREKRVIGVDLDGVLANFNRGYREQLIEITGRDLIPLGEEPPCWNYATEHYGYTKHEDNATWKSITGDRSFWQWLDPLPGARDAIRDLAIMASYDEVYFITTRPGTVAKQQSEFWLARHGYWDTPTVLIARGEKGPLAKALQLTHFIDDKPENCFSVWSQSPKTEIYMPICRYNSWALEQCAQRGITVVQSVSDFTTMLTEDVAEAEAA